MILFYFDVLENHVLIIFLFLSFQVSFNFLEKVLVTITLAGLCDVIVMNSEFILKKSIS